MTPQVTSSSLPHHLHQHITTITSLQHLQRLIRGDHAIARPADGDEALLEVVRPVRDHCGAAVQ